MPALKTEVTWDSSKISEHVSNSENLLRVREDLSREKIHLCPERALLITEFFKKHDDPAEEMVLRKAHALKYLLSNKTVKIFPGELIVGSIGSFRKSCILQPELASSWLSQELLWIDKRKTNPFEATLRDKITLNLKVIPYWITRSMPSKMFPDIPTAVRYIRHALNPTFYLINEAGGIGHFLPDYESVIRFGTTGLKERINNSAQKQGIKPLHRACLVACEALEVFASRLSREAQISALHETDPKRKMELQDISRICAKVPEYPAETFHEALQSLWVAHTAVMLESLNSAVSFGRMDQYLYPLFARDIESGRITPEKALELLLLFSAKCTEHVFLLTQKISEFHGGFLVVQAAIAGGTDSSGKDSTNPLSFLMLEAMKHHRMRDPNFQVRIHENTPKEFFRQAVETAKMGFGVPAFFNDQAVVPALTAHGFATEDARSYAIVGCVEPSIPGKSFLSTDAGLFNLPICLELALNMGRRWNRRKREGAPTQSPLKFKNMDDLIEAFRTQVDFLIDRMIGEFHMVEKGNINYHPTPLSSMLVEGCIQSGRDLTEGGALYDQSGIQGVGVADVADSLAAIDTLIFREKKITMENLLKALRRNFTGYETIRKMLENAPKYGNDHALPDSYAALVVRIFHDSLSRHESLRGGQYVPGFYSVTCHVAFGKVTGALPSGRKAGEPFGSAIGPACGADRNGPTALLNSVSSLDSSLMPNGNALNMRFDPSDIEGERGTEIIEALIKGFFSRGGMEVQFNIVDPEVLKDARAHPGKYPDLIVRVAGYCARFDDLPDSAKQEIINRTRLKLT